MTADILARSHNLYQPAEGDLLLVLDRLENGNGTLGEVFHKGILPGRAAGAVVAHVVALGRVEVLVEVLEHLHATAHVHDLAVLHHLVDHGQLPVLLLARLLAVLLAGHHPLKQRHVGVRKEEIAVGGLPVAPGSSRFLVVALQALGQVLVDDKAHVGLVDAHTESDRGHDDLDFSLLPHRLDLVLDVRVHLGVVRPALDAVFRRERRGRAFSRFARERVHDTGIVGVLGGNEVAEAVHEARLSGQDLVV